MFKKLEILALIVLVFVAATSAQDTQELKAEREASKRLKGEHPLVAIEKSAVSSLRPELVGVHPRVFLTQAEIDQLKAKAKNQKELWQTALSSVKVFGGEPPPPPAEKRRAQNDVGLGIAEAAFMYKMTGEKKYIDAARKYMDAACSYDIWGYASNKPNVDLAAGHLLYGMGWGYDLLYNDLTPAEQDKYRTKLIRQARLMYDFFKPKTGKSYAYSQNHTFIPVTGLAIAAYALMGETPEAKQWAALSRAIYDRVLATYSADGYYYEGMEYWIFSTPWLIHYMDAQLHATGEDLYKTTPGLRLTYKYLSHATLPGGEFNFDFGDIYSGPITRARKGDDYERERIDGHFRTNYGILYNLASHYASGEAQGVADWLKSKGQVNAEEFWTFIWYNSGIKSVPIERQEKWHYFPDHEVVYWRSSWADDATAFAFKAGPPEGHATEEKLKQFPDWRLSSGHAHPDAGSFIIWSAGKYLTGDSGYAGVPMTEHHNTVVFDGKGQGSEGNGHDAFSEVPYERLNGIRLRDVKMGERGVSLFADLAPAYVADRGIDSFTRSFTFTAPGEFMIGDTIKMARAAKVTEYLHSDTSIVKSGDGYTFENGKPVLFAEIMAPTLFDAVIEPNIVTAPGPPGNVDKGERETRGVRLAVSTKDAVTNVEFKTRLRIKR
ncbi:MAG: DUF4962 domain-containing protein [Acidobacteriota bacterium]